MSLKSLNVKVIFGHAVLSNFIFIFCLNMSHIKAIQVQLGPPMVPKTIDAYKKTTKKNSSFVY